MNTRGLRRIGNVKPVARAASWSTGVSRAADRGVQEGCGLPAVELEAGLLALAADHQAPERRGLRNAQEADDLMIEDARVKMQVAAKVVLPVTGDVGCQHDRLVALDGARNRGRIGWGGEEDLAKRPRLLRTGVGRDQPSA